MGRRCLLFDDVEYDGPNVYSTRNSQETPVIDILPHAALAWMTIFFSLVIIGTLARIFDCDACPHPCESPLRHFEYVMPGFRVGCWLGAK